MPRNGPTTPTLIEERNDKMLLRLAQKLASIHAAHQKISAWTWEDDESVRSRHRWLAMARGLLAEMIQPSAYQIRRSGTNREDAIAIWSRMARAAAEEQSDEWRPGGK